MCSYSKVLLTLCLALSFANVGAQQPPLSGGRCSPVIQELKDLVRARPDFERAFNAAFAAQDQGSYWGGKTLDDMYEFLDAWRVYDPGVKNPTEFVDRFKALYALDRHRGFIKEGLAVVRDGEFSAWMKKFVMARKEYLDSPASTKIVDAWIKSGAVDAETVDLPKNGYVSFNDFFTRHLKLGVRPLSEPANELALVSPADCMVSEITGPLTADTDFEVKGQEFNVAALLGDPELGKTFEGGRALLCMLMPANYHRFHAPISGKIMRTNQLGGYYFGAKGFVDHFFEHRRGYYLIENKKVGTVGFVAVGIGDISSVNMSGREREDVKKGDEIGNFAYGGSAIVLLFQQGQLNLLTLPAPTNPMLGSVVKVRSKIGILKAKLD